MDELKKILNLWRGLSPIPPRHIMETLVEMKENGSYEEKMKKMAENFDEIKKRVEMLHKSETHR